MAESERKSRDIKNLKARLGRTVTSGQGGKPASAPPPAAGGSVPPAARVGSWPPVTGKSSRPPASGLSNKPSSPSGRLPAPGGVTLPKPGSGALPAPGGIAAPPFAQPPQQEQKPAPTAQRSADPFAQQATAAAGEKKVTLVIDDSAISESEIGKKSRIKNLILIAAGILVGIILGFMVGNTAGDRKMWETVINDTKDLYKKVNEVSQVVEEAKNHVQTLYSASQGGSGQQARVDYSAIESLVALKAPLSANAFHRKRYMAFNAGTVDDLFDYYNNINLLWSKFSILGAKTAGAKKREELDKSATAADALLNEQYGLIPFIQGETIAGGIVLVEIPQVDESQEEDPQKQYIVNVSTKKGGKQVERTRFVGQPDFVENPSNYVIMVNKARSMGLLGQSASLFGEFRSDVNELNAIMTKTMEIQGRLIKTMGEIAAKY